MRHLRRYFNRHFRFAFITIMVCESIYLLTLHAMAIKVQTFSKSSNPVVRITTRLVLFVVRTTNEFITINGHYFAATISFYTMLCLFPTSLMAITIFSWIVGSDGVQDIITFFIRGLTEVFPILQEDVANELVTTLSDSLTNFSGFSGATAIFFTVLASTAVFGSLRKSVNQVWGISKPRNFFIEKLIDFVMSVGAVVLLFVSVGITILNNNLETIITYLLPAGTEYNVDVLQRILVTGASYIIPFLVFSTLYWWLPATRVRYIHVIPISIGAAIAFELSKILFLVYLNNVGAWLGSIYGVFAAVIVFLTFVYIASIILLVGAMLNSKFIKYLARIKRQSLNEELSLNLHRVRQTPGIIGISLISGSSSAAK